MVYVASNILAADTVQELLDVLDAYYLSREWIEINGRIRPRIIYRLYGNMKRRIYEDRKVDIVSLRELVEKLKISSPVTEEELAEWEKRYGKLPKLSKDKAEELWQKIMERINKNKNT